MDFYTNLAFSVLFSVLSDRKQLPRIRRALLKLQKVIWANFSQDEEFRKVVFADTTDS